MIHNNRKKSKNPKENISTTTYKLEPLDIATKILSDVLIKKMALDQSINYWFKKLRISDSFIRSEIYQMSVGVCKYHGFLLKQLNEKEIFNPKILKKEIRWYNQQSKAGLDNNSLNAASELFFIV